MFSINLDRLHLSAFAKDKDSLKSVWLRTKNNLIQKSETEEVFSSKMRLRRCYAQSKGRMRESMSEIKDTFQNKKNSPTKSVMHSQKAFKTTTYTRTTSKLRKSQKAWNYHRHRLTKRRDMLRDLSSFTSSVLPGKDHRSTVPFNKYLEYSYFCKAG